MQSVGVFVGGYGILPYLRHPLKSSHRIHRIHGSFWRRIFSHGFHRCSQKFLLWIFSHRFHRCSQIFRLRFCLLICAHLCLSVGGTSLPECSVCSACSVGHSLPVCLFGSVVVFSHGIHGMLGCVIGGVGMAGCHTLLICAYPCLSVGGFLCQKVLCVLRVLWDTLPICFVGAAEAAAPAW